MSLTYPLGLLGLILVPVIIIIYILRSKYNEQTVPSTYIWHLSEKFLKRRNPLSQIAGLISLILQLLMVTFISFAIAHPVFTLPGAAKDYCFILDASGSMNTSDDGEMRFDEAKEEIIDVIKDSKDGSSYKLISVSNETVILFDGMRDKDRAIEILEDTYPTHAAVSHEELIGIAQTEFDNNTSALIYLVTDKSYETVNNVEVISVGDSKSENYAVENLTYSYAASRLTAKFDLISFVSDAEIEVKLAVDGNEASRATASLKAGQRTPFTLEGTAESFSSFTVEITSADSYSLDNSLSVYNPKSDKTYSVLIVSESGFFFEAVIDALVDSDVKVIDPDEYANETDEYGLYIFDSYSPERLPNGSVWLINCDKNVADSGFDVRAKNTLKTSDVIEKSTSTATSARKLLEGVSGKDIYISRYLKYSGMYLKFTTLFTYDSNPLIFAGTNGVGERQVVFGFDLHESDFALKSDFVILLGNLLEYSFPDIVDRVNYTVGEEATVNILSSVDGYRAESPSGKSIFIDTAEATSQISLTEVGVYTVTATVSGKEVAYKIFSGAAPEESEPVTTEGEFSVSGEKTYDSIDGRYDPTVLLFVLIILLFVADWGVYCYEKYQLR